MKNFLSKFSKVLLITLAVFVLSGVVLPQKVSAQASNPAAGYADADHNIIPANPSNNSSWWIEWVFQPFIAWMVTIMLKFVSLLTGMGGLVLNGAIYHTVVNISQNYAQLKVIDEVWGIVRDVSNIFFIFVLLYAAIQKVLGIGEDVQRLIMRIVVVAILINFSLFFTKVVIDISNLLALTFYDAIVPNAATQGLTGTGLSNAFMQHLNLQGLYQVDGAENISIAGIITTGIMGTIMLLITAFILFAVGLMFIIRYVILIVVLILSPIAFVSFVLPGLSGYRKQWTDALINQSFFAPVYFMLTWVTLKVLDGVTSIFGSASGSLASVNTIGIDANGAATAATVGFFPIFINYIVVIAFLIFSFVVAKGMSSKSSMGLTGFATKLAGGATLGLAGRFGRGTFGRIGQSVADSENLKDMAAKGGVSGFIARRTLDAGRKTSGASFDMRGAGFADSLSAGKGQKGGFSKDLKDKIDAQKKYADALKPADLVIARREDELDRIKKAGGSDKDIKKAQDKVDELKGVDENEARKRKVKEIREAAFANGERKSEKQAKQDLAGLEGERMREIVRLKKERGLTQKQAEDIVDADTSGKYWKPITIKSAVNRRKEEYAKDTAEQVTQLIGTDIKIPVSFSGGRLIGGFVGPVKRERLEEALAIRKSMKEKKASEKIAEEIEKQARESVDDSAPETPAPTAPAPAGGPTT